MRIIPVLDWLPGKMMAPWREAREFLKQLDYDLFLGNDVAALLRQAERVAASKASVSTTP